MKGLRKLLAKSATRRVITGLVTVGLASLGVAVGHETVSIVLLAISTIWLGAEGDEVEFDNNEAGA